MEVKAPEADENGTCAWIGIFDADSVKALDQAQYTAGIITVIFGIWLSVSVMTSRLFSHGSYSTLVNYSLAATLRRSTPGLFHALPFLKSLHFWQTYSFSACDFFGFWETFFAVFEIEGLTMVCIERYVLAKYKSKGWQVPPGHYYLYCSLCVIFGFAYAYPPVVGLGRYAEDFDCMHCTFDMVLPTGGWKMYMVVFVFFMRSIKPTIMMLLMLYWAHNLEIKRHDNLQQKRLTKGVGAAACSFIICGAPITMIRGWVILSQLIYGEIVKFPDDFISIAMLLHWSSPSLVMLGLSAWDPLLRRQMVIVFANDEPETEEIRRSINNTTNDDKID